METVVKRFDELTVEELYEILKLRSEVFVVEQNCVYQDLDDIDKEAYHVYLKDGESMIAYLRVIDKNKRLLNPYGFLINDFALSYHGSDDANESYIETARRRSRGG